jgi:hypothetical protein
VNLDPKRMLWDDHRPQTPKSPSQSDRYQDTCMDQTRRYAAVALALAVYLASYPVFEALSGVGAGAVAILPVGVVTWFYGVRAGIVAAVLAIPLNIGLEMLTSDRSLEEWLKAGGVIGHAALLGRL